MERILLLMAVDTYQDAESALQSAQENAAAPQRVSYGCILREEPDESALAAMRTLGTVLFLAPAQGAWHAFPDLWQGEGFVLLVHPAMRFTRHWDIGLLHALRLCRPDAEKRAVLTGFLPTPDDPVDAVSPVAAEGFDEGGCLCFHPGTPLRYARQPELSAFLHPAFCFAPAAFFQDMAGAEAPLFLAAFEREWMLFTLHKPLIHLAWGCPIAPCPIPEGTGSAEALARFGMKFSMKLPERKLSAMARTGIFSSDLTFPLHVPVMVRLQEAWHEAINRRSKLTPMCVTAAVTLPQPGQLLPDEAVNRFRMLAGIRNLSLLCFADGEMARRLMPVLPNLLEYKERYALPVKVAIRPADKENYLRLSKPFLLAQGREKFLSHSHYAWIDYDYLRYPVYERAALDWETLCTDKIVLATVGGQVDTSMFMVPEERLSPLCREVQYRCWARLAAGQALPAEGELWQELLHDLPDWFTIIELPAFGGLLDLTMLSRSEEFHVQ